jgi:hypothetical protein
MFVLAVSNIDFIGYVCFFVGLGVLLAGVYNGMKTSLRGNTDIAKSKLEDARQSLDDAKGHIEATRAGAADLAGGGGAADAADKAGASADAAKTALEQVQGIIAALPEGLRFSGLLVLIGTVLMGVATTEFGGVSLF